MKNSKLKQYILSYWDIIAPAILAFFSRKKYRLPIMSSEQTIAHIKKTNCSIARYGDGEFDLMMQVRPVGYQEISDSLSNALQDVFRNTSKHLLICLPYPMVSTRGLKRHGKIFWREWCLRRQKQIVTELRKLISADYTFGDSFVSRPYSGYVSPKYSQKIFMLLKELWNNKDILFVEGNQTRLGVGNDLFDNAKSIKRILCPAENAFDVYDKILKTTLSYWHGELVILALGPTATVLASDLSKNGVQALDLGHVDIQYEWYLTGTSFAPVKGKYTNEAHNGSQVESCEDETYISQIIAEVK